MRPLSPLVALIGLALAPACRSAAPDVAPLTTLDTLPAAYSARLTAGAARITAEWEGFAPASADHEEDEEDPEDEKVGEPRFIHVACRLVRMSRERAAQLLDGDVAATHARRVALANVEQTLDRLVEAGAAEQMGSPRIATIEGQVAAISTFNQVAYIKAFEILQTDLALIGDPVVDVAEDGMQMHVRGEFRDDEAAIELEIALLIVDQELPIPTREVRIPGSSAPVTIQLPIHTLQRLRATAVLGPDDCLVLGGLGTDSPDELLFAFVTAHELSASEIDS
ncbi:MAG: hypothetical protein O7B99_11430 [Planctomycetota bacterium]|nr:hypothetical protein [Planctomycetota bacterium]